MNQVTRVSASSRRRPGAWRVTPSLTKRLQRVFPYQRYLQRGTFLANVAILASWGLVAQVLNLVITPVLTRVYSPRDFGIYALFTNTAVTFAVVAGLRYEYAIVLPEEEHDAVRVAWLALALDLAVGVSALFVAVTGLGSRIAAALRVPELAPYVTWIAPALTLLGAYAVFTYWAIRHKEYSRLAQSRFVISAVMAASQLLVGLGAHRSSGGLIAGMIAGQIAGAVFLAISTGFRRPEALDLSAIKTAARRYSHFPKYSAIGSLLDGLSALLPVALLTATFSPAIAGHFAVADRLMRMPSVLLGSSLTQVFYQKIAESRRDPDRCAALMRRTWTRLALVGAIPMLTVVLAGPSLFAFVLGPQWRASGEYAQILSVGLFVHFIAYPTSNGIVAFERLGIMLAWQLLMTVSIIGVFFGSQFLLHDSVKGTLWLFSGSLAVVYTASLAAQWYVVRSAAQYPTGAPSVPALSER